jgi:hypothetical protein
VTKLNNFLKIMSPKGQQFACLITEFSKFRVAVSSKTGFQANQAHHWAQQVLGCRAPIR